MNHASTVRFMKINICERTKADMIHYVCETWKGLKEEVSGEEIFKA